MDKIRTHKMNLHPAPYKSILSGKKTIEMRLFDEKRQLIQKGDVIVFYNNATNESLKASVIELYQYSDFNELYAHHDKISIGYDSCEKAEPDDMLLYYSKEQIEQFGVLAIEIKVI